MTDREKIAALEFTVATLRDSLAHAESEVASLRRDRDALREKVTALHTEAYGALDACREANARVGQEHGLVVALESRRRALEEALWGLAESVEAERSWGGEQRRALVRARLAAALAVLAAHGSTAAPGEGGVCAHCGQQWTAEAVDVDWTSGAHDIGVASCPACGYPALVKLDPPARALAEHGAPGPDDHGHAAWRCRCGAWNHAACRACGAGPDERYASRAELDALSTPGAGGDDEGRGR